MNSDDSDKTVFRQPPAADSTIIRPMPGGRRANPAQGGNGMPGQPGVYGSGPGMAAATAGPVHREIPAEYVPTGEGLNPLVQAASPLIAIYEKTKRSISHPDVEGFYQRLVNELKAFELRGRGLAVKPESVLAARYVLCTVLDEAVLNTPWGADSNWPQRTLLSTFHNETGGGEKFFLILDRMRQAPMDNLYMIELMYILLSLGFEGKYKLQSRGRDSLEQIRDDLFQIIRTYRGEYERELSPAWAGLGRIKSSLTQYLPLWVVAAAMGVILMLAYSGFRYSLYNSSVPVVHQLGQIGGESAE